MLSQSSHHQINFTAINRAVSARGVSVSGLTPAEPRLAFEATLPHSNPPTPDVTSKPRRTSG